MRTFVPLFATLAAAIAVGGCSGGSMSLPQLPRLPSLSSGDALSYAQVQAVQRGLSASQVRDAFGEPQKMSRRADGTIERMDYAALDANGGSERLLLAFDARERLVEKTFTGKVLRP